MLTFGTSGTDNDLAIDTNGLLITFEDKEALADKLNQRLKMFYAEWFLDTTRGIPYFVNILGENINQDIAASILTQEILKEDEVITIDSVDFSLDSKTRLFTYSASLSTIFGETNFTFTNGIN